MTDIDEALAWADRMTAGKTFYDGMPTDMALCAAILAAEVRRLRDRLVRTEEAVDNMPCFCTREVDEEYNWIGECYRCKALREYTGGD